MPRPLRIEYEGAFYHVINRGNRREPIFLGAEDRRGFLEMLGRACGKTGWEVHAYCLMSNHFHLVLDTPQANLVAGMKWLLGTYTQWFNRGHRLSGHLFQGRYKAQHIDGRSPGYLRAACDYVHLNPVRAGLVKEEEKLESYSWSSYPCYLQPKERPEGLRVDRVLGEHGLKEENARARREFGRRMEAQRAVPKAGAPEPRHRGWKLGADDFVDWLADKLSRPGRAGEEAAARGETDAVLAERLVQEALRAARWREIDLSVNSKGHPVKVEIARQLREVTPVSRRWIAERLRMGSPSYVSNLLSSVNSKL